MWWLCPTIKFFFKAVSRGLLLSRWLATGSEGATYQFDRQTHQDFLSAYLQEDCFLSSPVDRKQRAHIYLCEWRHEWAQCGGSRCTHFSLNKYRKMCLSKHLVLRVRASQFYQARLLTDWSPPRSLPETTSASFPHSHPSTWKKKRREG